MAYDGFGRQSLWIFPSKTTAGVADASDFEQYRYDPNGNRTSLRKRDGAVLAYQYDALNRLAVKQTPGHVWDVRYVYDLRGLQTEAVYAVTDWGVANRYDGFGRLVSTTTNMGGVFRTVAHRYDLEGRGTELTFPDGQRFWTRRDGLGRAIESYQGPLGDSSTIMASFSFDRGGRLARFSRRWGSATNYDYDPVGGLARLEHGIAGGNDVSTFGGTRGWRMGGMAGSGRVAAGGSGGGGSRQAVRVKSVDENEIYLDGGSMFVLCSC